MSAFRDRLREVKHKKRLTFAQQAARCRLVRNLRRIIYRPGPAISGDQMMRIIQQTRRAP